MALLSSCIWEEEYTNDPQGNFEQLWKVIDRQYCFLNYKQIDWDDIYTQYQKCIIPNMSNEGLFEVLGEILYELQDGYANLTPAYNVSYHNTWHQDYPRNFRADLVEDSYLGHASTGYHTAAGLKCKMLKNDIGYIWYESPADPIDNGNLGEILSYLAVYDGLIIDMRDNDGGNATNSAHTASRLTNEKVLAGCTCHKIGTGHNDFSRSYAIYLEPANGVRWQKKAVVLTNHRSSNVTSNFVNHMRCLSNVTIIRDRTGGGSDIFFASELPNGWSACFSASPHSDAQMKHIESNIKPDVKVDMLQGDGMRGKDALIEIVRRLLNE